MAMLAIIVSTGIMVDFYVASVDAWHSQFTTKKECVDFMKDTHGNSSKLANIMCKEIVPH